MNQKQKQILKLCADQPKTVRQLVSETGESANIVRCNLHSLVKQGAVMYEELDDRYGTRLYESDPNWKPKGLDETTYKPLGICVLGVWM